MMIMKVKISDIIIPERRARSTWSEDQKQLLEGAVQEYGQLSDPLVRPLPDGKYELVDGESRIRAFEEAGITEIDVKPVDLNDKDASLVNVLMNIARGEQDAMGIALAFKDAMTHGLTEDEIAVATRHTREWVRFHVNLNIIPEVYQDALRTGQLKVGHIRQAFRLPTPAEQAACLNMAVTQGHRVKVIENYVDNVMAEYKAQEILKEYITFQDPTPRVDPQRLLHVTRCLSCQEQVPSAEISHPIICEECYALLRHVAPRVGKGMIGIKAFNEGFNLWRQFVQEQQFQLAQQATGITPAQGVIPQPAQTIETSAPQDMIVKPEGMPAEEWASLKAALRTRHST